MTALNTAAVLSDLARVKAVFQLRAIMAAMPLPNPPASTLPDAAPDAGSPHSGASGVGKGDGA